MRRAALLLALSMTAAGMVREPSVRVHTIGDSTMADRPDPAHPEHGWGTLLRRVFTADVVVYNYAVNGRSTKSFIDEGKWKSALGALQPGDYMIIQFGHNDEKVEDSTRYAAAQTDYRRNLERFVSEARDKGAVPILCTPIVRRKFDAKGTLEETHGEYPDVVRVLAAARNVPLLDLQKLTHVLVQRAGPEGSKRLYVWLEPKVSSYFPDGRQDDTHLSEAGATEVAKLAAGAIKTAVPALGRYLRPAGD